MSKYFDFVKTAKLALDFFILEEYDSNFDCEGWDTRGRFKDYAVALKGLNLFMEEHVALYIKDNGREYSDYADPKNYRIKEMDNGTAEIQFRSAANWKHHPFLEALQDKNVPEADKGWSQIGIRIRKETLSLVGET